MSRLSQLSRLLLCTAGLWLLSGCALFGGLKVDSVATSAQRPSNVAVYVSVTEGDRPVTGLGEKDFTIYEDDQKLTAEQTQQTLLPGDVAAIHRALLLVDMSGAVTEGQTRDQITEATLQFVNRVRPTESVTVYAFDGGPRLRLIGDFPKGGGEVEDIPALRSYQPADKSSNLHSSVVEAIKQLNTRLMAVQKPLRIGTLVVFARGPDLAGRVTEDVMRDAIDATSHHVLGVGLEGEDAYRVDIIGRDGEFLAPSMASLTTAFADAGSRTAALVDQYYLLSYCSPARAGKRELTVEVVTYDDQGEEISGKVRTDFDATGFSSGCNPKARPRFVPQPDDEEEEEEEEEPQAPPAQKQRSAPQSSPPPAQAEPDEGDAIVPPPDKPGYAH